MKALTICQPYAELIARGDKRVENRRWPTGYRGLLAIHAGKSREWLDLNDAEDADESCEIPLREMSFGAVVAVARLVDCLDKRRIDRGFHDRNYPWLRGHEHTEGPWCWVLDDVRRLQTPVPYRGAQGLFDVPDELLFTNAAAAGGTL
jgi:hypothetical protein